MPYIEERFRAVCRERGLDQLCELVQILHHEQGAGVVAYSIYRLLRAFVGKPKFWRLALAGGVALFAVLEFYRRIVTPYEQEKMTENGDV